MKYLFDTNTIIYAYKNLGQVRSKWASVAFDDVALCSVNIFELEFGLAKSENPTPLRHHVQALSGRHPVLSFDSPAAKLAGQVRGYLGNLGKPIGPYDLLIAGIALANDLTLVTRNVSEFGRVPNLRLEDWY